MKTIPLSFGTMILCLILCTTGFILSAQDPYLQESHWKIRKMASDITRQYQPKLVMGAEQAILFRQKVAEFLIHREWVENHPELSPGARYHLLKRISSRETSEMAQILEMYKWQEYMRVKRIIQPLPEPPARPVNAIASHQITKQ